MNCSREWHATTSTSSAPDNDVTPQMDQLRLQWNTDDVILNRPALSRWHPDFADAFAEFMGNNR